MFNAETKDDCHRARIAAQDAAGHLHCAMTWFDPDDDEERDPKEMLAMLLRDAEQSVQMALIAIQKAKAAI